MLNLDKFYLLACIARSYDQYHINVHNIHLIMSVFYTNEDRIKKLASEVETVNGLFSNKIIIRVTIDKNASLTVNQLNDTTTEIIISISNILSLNGINGFNNFIDKLIGNHFSQVKQIENNMLNNVLFVFENIN